MPGEKFLSSDQIKERAKGWTAEAHKIELQKNRYGVGRYKIDRSESELKEPVSSIEYLHGTSFIKQEIPEIIRRKKPGEKVKILDVGGGIGNFTEKMRGKFPNETIIYSTGLSKSAAKKYRKERGMKPLDKKDLKWRSVYELTDYPEFDLIIDTFGEQFLTVKTLNELRDYLTVLVKKLLPKGIASIGAVKGSIFGAGKKDQDQEANEFAQIVSNELGVIVRIKRIPGSRRKNYCIRMEKLDVSAKE